MFSFVRILVEAARRGFAVYLFIFIQMQTVFSNKSIMTIYS